MAAATAAGCRSDATQLVVWVDSDLSVPQELSGIDVSLQDPDGTELLQRSFDVSELPLSFGVEPPGGDAGRPIRISVQSRGTRIVTRVVETGFIDGQRLLVPIFLSSRCEGQTCTDGGTCDFGSCINPRIEPTMLAVIEPGEETTFDAGVAADPDTGIDGGGIDAAPDTGEVDSGPDTGPADAGDEDSGPRDGPPEDAGVVCPDPPNATGVLDRSQMCTYECLPDFWDLNGLIMDGCEYACVLIGQDDLPDDAFVDANCDGIDGDVTLAIFVDANSPTSSPAGTAADPFVTISEGITAASAMGLSQVLISVATYPESITAVGGVSLYGGYEADANWSRSANRVATIAADGTVVRADTITTPTTIDLLIIEALASSPQPGQNIVGLHIIESDGLTLSNLTIQTDDGQSGSSGGNGAPGAPGGAGNQGLPQCGGNNCTAIGGGGGASPCARPGGAGGDSFSGSQAGPGVTGQRGFNGASGGGAGGLGGPGADFCGPASNCMPAGAPRPVGGPGMGGGIAPAGIAGLPGPAGLASGGLLNGSWHAGNGGDGADGTHGRGGGGGGGGGSNHHQRWFMLPLVGCEMDTAPCPRLSGGPGGGGGGGGCLGTGGTGGSGAGSAIGILVQSSANLNFVALSITAGAGGDGGSGGGGGPGGGGGTGGPAGTRSDASAGLGAAGGPGSRGGNGGPGGGGAGGTSACVLLYDSSSIADADVVNNLVSCVVVGAGIGGQSPADDGEDGLEGELVRTGI